MTEDARPLKDRVYVLDDPDGWRTMLHFYQDNLVITPHGIFVVRREDLMTYARLATRFDLKKILGQTSQTGPPVGHVELPKRLPFSLVVHATSFFREAWRLHQREDVLLIYFFFNENRYELRHPPIQWADGAGVRYDIPETPVEAVRLGSLHSHGKIDAHHSAEDRRDDVASPGVHIVIGCVDRATPSIFCSVSDGRTCYPVCVADVFEEMKWPSFPKEWLIKVPRPGPADIRAARSHERRTCAEH